MDRLGLKQDRGSVTHYRDRQGPLPDALKNFEAAGLIDFIYARLADAHALVPVLEGPFDFVFQNADKAWYPRYFELLLPKLENGGCYTAHNVSMPRRRGGSGIGEFLEMLEATPNLKTEIINTSRAGLSVSCKTRAEEKE